MTFTGTNLTGANFVSFGGTVNATGAITANTDTSITVTTPARTVGTYNTVVTTPGGASATSSADRFGFFQILSYKTVGTTSWAVPNVNVQTVEYLVVGGGGGGGRLGGGGGAGGFRTGTITNASGSYNVTVGNFGAGAGNNVQGSNGLASQFATFSAAGGGGAGTSSTTAATRNGRNGGSGGGGARSTGTGGTGNTPVVSPSQGNDGATGRGAAAPFYGGGGGGASAVGTSGSGTIAGNGGVGSSAFSTLLTQAGEGVDVGGTRYIAGGGGGGATSGTAGSGGFGGGGNGAVGGNVGSNAIANTGGGGGGSGATNRAGGNGGSGIVIIKFY